MKPVFVRAHSSVDSEIIIESCVAAESETINDNASEDDTWIHQRTKSMLTPKLKVKTESLPTQKASTRLPSELKPGFVRAHSPS
jgi:hypothetical protein